MPGKCFACVWLDRTAEIVTGRICNQHLIEFEMLKIMAKTSHHKLEIKVVVCIKMIQ